MSEPEPHDPDKSKFQRHFTQRPDISVLRERLHHGRRQGTWDAFIELLANDPVIALSRDNRESMMAAATEIFNGVASQFDLLNPQPVAQDVNGIIDQQIQQLMQDAGETKGRAETLTERMQDHAFSAVSIARAPDTSFGEKKPSHLTTSVQDAKGNWRKREGLRLPPTKGKKKHVNLGGRLTQRLSPEEVESCEGEEDAMVAEAREALMQKENGVFYRQLDSLRRQADNADHHIKTFRQWVVETHCGEAGLSALKYTMRNQLADDFPAVEFPGHPEEANLPMPNQVAVGNFIAQRHISRELCYVTLLDVLHTQLQQQCRAAIDERYGGLVHPQRKSSLFACVKMGEGIEPITNALHEVAVARIQDIALLRDFDRAAKHIVMRYHSALRDHIEALQNKNGRDNSAGRNQGWGV
jgi:hypothetical protein